jgi:hypothetical protein
MRAAASSKLQDAVRDLENRTLAELNGELTRLVYLSSTRDYNTGEYQHAGLADKFGPETAGQALAQCHQSAFQDLLYSNLADLVAQLAAYIDSTGAEKQKVLHAWRQLQAYRVLVPSTCDALSADLFASNIKIALEALRIAPAEPLGNSPAVPLLR